MALESGKSQGNGRGIKTALVGAGLGLASLIGWNALDSKPDNGQIIKPDEDPKDVESDKAVALKAEGVKADILQQLVIPSNLPPLHGVKEETLKEKSRKLLQEVDRWLHVPAKPFDLKPEADMSEEEREHFMNYKDDFRIAVEKTKEIMKDDPLFWEAKQKIDAAFPNYELMGEVRNEYTDSNYPNEPTKTFGWLMERPKLTDYDGKTMTGFKPQTSSLAEWQIYNHNGLIYFKSPDPDYNGGALLSGSVEDFIATIEAYMKRKSLIEEYHNADLVEEYEKQGFK